MEYILAIDQGTHASRALVIDTSGQVVSSSLFPLTLSRPQPDRVEQDAEQIVQSLQSAIETSLQALTHQQRDAIRACGIATQRSTVTAWHRNGAPLSPAINWQDTRGAAQLQALKSRAAAIRRISGLPLSAHYGASKLHWLHQLHGNDPDSRLGPLVSFLLYRATEQHTYAVDHTNAQRMQLLDIHSLNWSSELADWFEVPLAGLPECRPAVHGYGTLANYRIPVSAVCGDQNAAWFGSGIPEPGTALVNLGSGAFILAGQAGNVTDPDMISSIASSDSHRCEYLLEGTVNGAGNALQWLADQRQVVNLQSRLATWLQQVTAPPLFMNTVGGLGSPWWRRGPQPKFVPDSDQLSEAELAVAVAESILFLVQYNLERIRKLETISGVRVSGGLSQLTPLCQKLANLTGLAVERNADPEASSRGVAWLAAGRPQTWRAPDDLQLFQPATDTGLRSRYQHFVEQLKQYIETGNDD